MQIGVLRGLVCVLMLFSSLPSSADAVSSPIGFGVDAGLGVKRGTAALDYSKAIIGLPKNDMVGEWGGELSGFLQISNLYSAILFNQTNSFSLFDSPQLEDNGAFGLVGLAFPSYSPKNNWNISIATGIGANWGTTRGPVLSDNWIGHTYESNKYASFSVPIELKASARFAEHIGIGLKYVVALNRDFSSNMLCLILELYN